MKKIRFGSRLTPEECECLVERRYMQMHASVGDPKNVVKLYDAFLAEKDDRERKRWSFAVEDPNDPDDGLICKLGEKGSDHKWFFHWSPKLIMLLEERHIRLSTVDEEFLYAAGKIHEAATALTVEVMVSLDAFFGNRYRLREALRESIFYPTAHSRSKLRIVSYMNAEEGGRRARIHRDRSFLTLHLFEEGGHLFGCRDQYGHGKFVIPRRSCKTPLFFGLKANVFTKNHYRALWHGSEGAPGEQRSAVIFFAHTNNLLQHATEPR